MRRHRPVPRRLRISACAVVTQVHDQGALQDASGDVQERRESFRRGNRAGLRFYQVNVADRTRAQLFQEIGVRFHRIGIRGIGVALVGMEANRRPTWAGGCHTGIDDIEHKAGAAFIGSPEALSAVLG